VEHPAVQALADWWVGQGGEVTKLGVDAEGRLDPEALRAALRPDTALVSVMAANNETGVLFPVAELAPLAKAQGALFHVDATQAVGKVPVDVRAWGADLLNLSGHKFHGPKGVGALFVRRGVRIKPLLLGGHQERGRRGGTENVPGLVGLGKAAALAASHLGDMARVAGLRDRLEAELLASVPDMKVHGAGAPRLPNTSLLGFAGLEGEALLMKLSEGGVAVSTGSACTTGQKEPSHVLRAMGAADAAFAAYAHGTIRVSLSRESTDEEVDRFLALMRERVPALRSSTPFAR
jgi:cysteine desulfurase